MHGITEKKCGISALKEMLEVFLEISNLKECLRLMPKLYNHQGIVRIDEEKIQNPRVKHNRVSVIIGLTTEI